MTRLNEVKVGDAMTSDYCISLARFDAYSTSLLREAKTSRANNAAAYRGRSLRLFRVGLAALLAIAAVYAWFSEGHAQNILGGVEIKEEQVKGPLPERFPATIYVADFELDADKYVRDEGVRGALPGKLGKRLPRLLPKGSPAERAREIVETMSESLVQQLRAKDMHAEHLRAGNLPQDGWLLQGVFTEVDEGNRLKRAGIGFGSGATSMELQVRISNLASSEPRAAFVAFGTAKDPSRIPGAAVTRNPYVAAAKFVLQKNATEKDIGKTAAHIAEEILKFKKQIEEKQKSGSE